MDAEAVTLGWEEWVSLPRLNLPAIQAKVDTGAKTSALHATDIQLIEQSNKTFAKFTVHPVPSRLEVKVECMAPVIDQRVVISSNGEQERRYVIETDLEIGKVRWKVEITLANRDQLAYRMLIGRQALRTGVIIDPSKSYCQGKRPYNDYFQKPVSTQRKATLNIAILSREPNSYSSRKLLSAGRARGHRVEIIDTTRCYMVINAEMPEVHYDGRKLDKFDAIIPRIGSSITEYGTAVIRQFETLGAFCVNGSSGIEASRNKLHAHQMLAKNGVSMPRTAFASSPKDTMNLITLAGNAPLIVKLLESTQGRGVVLVETRKAAESVVSAFRGLKANFLVQNFIAEAGGQDIRCLVIGNKVVGSMARRAQKGEFRSNLHLGGVAERIKITPQERALAVRAAKTFGLKFSGVDMLRASDGPKVLEVNSSPGLQGIEFATGKNIADLLFVEIERQLGFAAN